MSVVISVTNQKGGVGKTVTVSTLASALTSRGFRVLAVDLDPQRNLDMVAGRGMAIPVEDTATKSVLDVLKGDCSMADAIVQSNLGDLVRASSRLSQWTGRHLITRDEYASMPQGEILALMDQRYKNGWGEGDHKVLRGELASVRNNYDYILMDTNPSLTLLTINSLFAADYVLIPAFAEAASRDAIRELWDTIRGPKAFNPEMRLQIAGILITKFASRNLTARKYAEGYEKMAKSMGTILFQQKIRQSISVAEYSTSQEDLLRYDPTGKSSLDYLAFVDEFIRRIDTLEGRA